MPEQLDLIPGVRRAPPSCYLDVEDALNAAFEVQPAARKWSVARLAKLLRESDRLSDAQPQEIERCLRIYRERNTFNGTLK